MESTLNHSFKVGDKAVCSIGQRPDGSPIFYEVCHTDNFGNVWFCEIQGKKKRGKAERKRLELMTKVTE